MKIALTGAGGKLGRAILPQALASGHTVVAIDRTLPDDLPDGVVGIIAQMSDYAGLCSAFEGCDALIHMAAIPSPKIAPEHEVHNNNVVGSYNAMRAAIAVGIKRICQGSSVNAMGLPTARSVISTIFRSTRIIRTIATRAIACRNGSASSRPTA